MADNDSQIDLKKRARRRLVGSAALALAAAIVLPMVMDHEPRPASQDVQIRIPSQEGSNFTSRVITGKALYEHRFTVSQATCCRYAATSAGSPAV